MKFIKYNANTKDENKNDCTRRALSLAYNIPYNEVEKEQAEIRNILKAKAYNYTIVTDAFIERHGYESILVDVKGITVKDFCKAYSTGIYLLQVLDSADPTSHLTCVIDGNIYDTWNCENYKIIKGYCITSKSSNINTSLKLSDYKHFIEGTVKKILTKYLTEAGLNAKVDFVAADYFDSTTERVRISIDLRAYNLKNYSDTFLIKLSYRTDNIEEALVKEIETNCLKLIKKIKRVITHK